MQRAHQCPKCGFPFIFGARFCENCGTLLSWPQPQPSTYQQRQQQQNYGYGQKSTSNLRRCIACKKRTLEFNSYNGLYECHNPKCRRRFTASEIANKQALVSPKWSKKPKKPKQYSSNVRINAKSLFRTFGKILIFATVIVIAALMVTSVCMFISNTLKGYALIAILILGLIFLSLCLQSFARRKLTFTRFFLVFLFSFMFIILSSTYLDVRTFDDIRNNISGAFSIPKGQFRESIDLIVQRTELKTVEAKDIDDKSSPSQIIPDIPSISTTKSTEKRVIVDGGILVGADGHYITLKNNPSASNPSWEQLKSFLLKDNTDQIPYDFGKFVCADFAERLHNNAELAGIRAAYVCIQLGPSTYYTLSGGHALNAFQTTDRGLVYIDCTGFRPGLNADKIVDVIVGQEYTPRSIFPQPGWSSVWSSMGKVQKIEVIEW